LNNFITSATFVFERGTSNEKLYNIQYIHQISSEVIQVGEVANANASKYSNEFQIALKKVKPQT
jgi:hypothetical protein